MILGARVLERIRPVAPFDRKVITGGLSGGLSHAGYDVHIREGFLMWPLRFVLASTLEVFDMPPDVMGFVHDKSTLARCGIAVQNTVIEPGWRGTLTLEITMHRWRVHRIRPGQPIAQIIFHKVEGAGAYAGGKYQDQPARPVEAIWEGRR